MTQKKKKRAKRPTKTKLFKKLDKIISAKIKERDNYTCQRCEKEVQGVNCQWCHIITRSNKRLRWDLNNSLVMCYYCHRLWHSSPIESTEWFAGKFKDRYDYLMESKNELHTYSVSELQELILELT